MTIPIDETAPDWAKALVTDLVVYIDSKLLEPRPDAEFKLANLPPASQFRGCDLFVPDGAGNKLKVTSDGTNWYYQEGTVV